MLSPFSFRLPSIEVLGNRLDFLRARCVLLILIGEKILQNVGQRAMTSFKGPRGQLLIPWGCWIRKAFPFEVSKVIIDSLFLVRRAKRSGCRSVHEGMAVVTSIRVAGIAELGGLKEAVSRMAKGVEVEGTRYSRLRKVISRSLETMLTVAPLWSLFFLRAAYVFASSGPRKTTSTRYS